MSLGRANLEQLTERWRTQHAREVVVVMVVRDLSKNKGRGLGPVLRTLKFPHVDEVKNARDLRCITLEGEDLQEAGFQSCDASWGSLAESDLRRANFSGANLARVCFAGANLAGAVFEGADCTRADFTRANLAGADFRRARLGGAVFEEAYAARSNFQNAVLKRANFRGANLDDVLLQGANCNLANFSYGGLDHVGSPPSRSEGLVYDLTREAYEKQVGLHGDPTRASGRLKKLRHELRANARDESAAAVLKPEPLIPDGMVAPAPERRPKRPTQRAPRPPLPVRPRTRREPRPVPAPARADPSLAALDEDAPQPFFDWARAIGHLTTIRPRVTKIVVELGDRSRLLFTDRT